MCKEKKYKWEFENIGDSLRVKIASGADIAHLSELDPKMWTVLSCPVKGLEIDEKSLAYIDTDGDGKIRVNDVINTATWITGVLQNPDDLMKGSDSIALSKFKTDNIDGARLEASARQILANLNKEGEVISLSETADSAAFFAKTKFNGDGIITEMSADDPDDKAAIVAAVATVGGIADRSGDMGVNADTIESFYKNLADYVAWHDSAVELPFAAQTEKALAAYEALDAKVRDYFMRVRLAAFSPDSISSLDVQTARIDAISAENLTGKLDEIAAYPIARITGKPEIDLAGPVNPAWSAHLESLLSVVVDPAKKTLKEADWDEIGTGLAAYSAWKNSKAGAVVEGLGIEAIKTFIAKDRKSSLLDLVSKDLALKEEASGLEMVDKFLHIYRDFYRLLRNFVTLNDFYSKDSSVTAIFQSGRLIVDQRECRLCMNVLDPAKHNATAAASGMYLIYCDCVAKDKPAKLQIVAAMTVGDIGDIFVGKNAIYYDNSGYEWDAVITKIIDNPISVAQAFWSPYRRIANAIEILISKNAAEKDSKMMSNATAKINATPASIPPAGTADAKPAAAPPFDIAKYAGIFAAIGVALGMIGTALSGLLKGLLALKWWQLIIVFVSIMLLISGPAMVMAWLKLRRRNIAPLLNANGWAVNAASKINIPFGETLTDQARFPKIKLKDPYAKKGVSGWQKAIISFSFVVLAVAVLWLFNLLSWAGLRSPLPRYNEEPVAVESVIEEASDSLVVLETVSSE